MVATLYRPYVALRYALLSTPFIMWALLLQHFWLPNFCSTSYAGTKRDCSFLSLSHSSRGLRHKKWLGHAIAEHLNKIREVGSGGWKYRTVATSFNCVFNGITPKWSSCSLWPWEPFWPLAKPWTVLPSLAILPPATCLIAGVRLQICLVVFHPRKCLRYYTSVQAGQAWGSGVRVKGLVEPLF